MRLGVERLHFEDLEGPLRHTRGSWLSRIGSWYVVRYIGAITALNTLC